MSIVYTVIDVETTGLDHTTDQIIEIAAVKYRSDGTEIGRFHTLVALDEGRELPPKITELTGITAEDLAGAPSEDHAILALGHFVSWTTVIAHNAPFDLAFISHFGRLHENFVCTRAMTKIAEPEESASLANVCSRHGIDLTGHHRAMNDVVATWKVLEVMRDKLAGGFDYTNVVLDLHERPLQYKPYNARVITDIGYHVYYTEYPEEGSDIVDLDVLDTSGITVIDTAFELDGEWVNTKGEAVFADE